MPLSSCGVIAQQYTESLLFFGSLSQFVDLTIWSVLPFNHKQVAHMCKNQTATSPEIPRCRQNMLTLYLGGLSVHLLTVRSSLFLLVFCYIHMCAYRANTFQLKMSLSLWCSSGLKSSNTVPHTCSFQMQWRAIALTIYSVNVAVMDNRTACECVRLMHSVRRCSAIFERGVAVDEMTLSMFCVFLLLRFLLCQRC